MVPAEGHGPGGHPSQMVLDLTNSTDDAAGVSGENHSKWCENNHIGGEYRLVDIGLQFLDSSVTGGSGTSSFDDTTIGRVRGESYQTYLGRGRHATVPHQQTRAVQRRGRHGVV